VFKVRSKSNATFLPQYSILASIEGKEKRVLPDQSFTNNAFMSKNETSLNDFGQQVEKIKSQTTTKSKQTTTKVFIKQQHKQTKMPSRILIYNAPLIFFFNLSNLS